MIKKTEQEILEAIKRSGGIVSNIADSMNCAWHTANKLCKRTKKTQQALVDETETLLDYAENTLLTAIKSGDVQAAKWVLSTKGKRRGYSERQELVNFNYNKADVKEIQDLFDVKL